MSLALGVKKQTNVVVCWSRFARLIGGNTFKKKNKPDIEHSRAITVVGHDVTLVTTRLAVTQKFLLSFAPCFPPKGLYSSSQLEMKHKSGDLRSAIRTGGATSWPAVA